jgi:hypothetical protein
MKFDTGNIYKELYTHLNLGETILITTLHGGQYAFLDVSGA